MTLHRTCSECATSIAGKATHTKTCSTNCRQKRARRLRKLDKAAAREETYYRKQSEPLRELVDVVRRSQTDVVKKVVEEQLAPIVRDALTEDTLQAIKKLLGLTSTAVGALAEDLVSDDPVIRQRAYSLAIKYTIGHPALVKADDSAGQGQMVVNFALPRPDQTPQAIEAAADELRTCDLCNTEKPLAEFVGDSDRCQACADEWKQRITDQFA